MKKYLFTALSLAVLVTSSAVTAQNRTQPSAASGQANSAKIPASNLSAEQITDKQLVEFAKVQQNLIKINDHYKGKIENGSDKEKVTKSLYKEMAKAVQSSPLEVSEYNSIAQNLSQSKDLQQRFTQIAQQMMQGQSAVSAQ